MFWLRIIIAMFCAIMSTGFAVANGSDNDVRIQIVDQKGSPVRNAVVELTPASGIKGRVAFDWPAEMAQRNLEFRPGTLIVAKGSTVSFPNYDRVSHSVYSFSEAARFEIDLFGRDQSRSYRFTKAGTVAVGCNIHDNMRGFIRVTETPFAAKTDGKGFVTLQRVPTGAAQIVIWHPRMRGRGNEHRIDSTIRSGELSKRFQVNLR